MNKHTMLALCFLSASAGLWACKDESPKSLAPTASALEAPKPKSATATAFEVQKSGSKVEFTMDAPIEKIRGKVNDTATGEVNVDLTDLTKSTAHLMVDIGDIELFQRKKQDEKDADYGKEIKNDAQNEHARTWLQIDEKTDAAVREKNRRVEMTVTKVSTETADVTKLTGDERTVKATVSGEFLLHGRKEPKSADVEVTFSFKDGKPVSMHIKTVKPFAVGLEEFEVKPRDTVGKLLSEGFSKLGKKVAKSALVSIDVTATAKGATAAASAPATATASAADAKSASAAKKK